MFPWASQFIPDILRKKWMKVDKVEANRDKIYEFIRVSIQSALDSEGILFLS